MRIRVENALAEEDTSVHWHGIALANDADGVPGITQDPVAAGSSYVYDFTPPHPGTFLYHSHVGLQLDRGLYGPLFVEPRREEMDYDCEAVLMLDDWLDGLSGSPDEQLQRLRSGGMSMGHGGGTAMPPPLWALPPTTAPRLARGTPRHTRHASISAPRGPMFCAVVGVPCPRTLEGMARPGRPARRLTAGPPLFHAPAPKDLAE